MIERYKFESIIKTYPDGYWVSYADHAAEVERLTASRDGYAKKADALYAEVNRLARERDRQYDENVSLIARIAELEKALNNKAYECPVCGTGDPNAYLRCNHPGCPDGRDPRLTDAMVETGVRAYEDIVERTTDEELTDELKVRTILLAALSIREGWQSMETEKPVAWQIQEHDGEWTDIAPSETAARSCLADGTVVAIRPLYAAPTQGGGE